jgi:hypothetical protein
MPFDEALKWAEKAGEHSTMSFVGPLTHAGYADVPVTYVFCEEDVCVTTEVQRKIIEGIEDEIGRKIDVRNLKAGHAPFVSKPEETVELLAAIAQES